ncbi:uncharacterized protein LOC129967479 [Argiope bruennichi]|uniref:uncharacterized protein LOC129967479 n=1 Tax=Argiope bruennichi TaxID=94029 RepID=UPI0024943DD6|nr:uncharacterized protein LOC129967479 [Argiope bruennichi]
MTDFQHSIVLFSGEDGLPLEFNVRNTNEKTLLKALIEHGGGLCSQSDGAIHLISSGTKVLNADLGKKLVSTQYIFDCVKQNYLLDVNDYVFTISEARTSDISDEESENLNNDIQAGVPDVNVSDYLEVISMNETLPSSLHMKGKNNISIVPPELKQNEMQQNLTSSNTSESFVEGSVGMDSNFKISSIPTKSTLSPEYKPLTSTAKDAFSENAQNNFADISDRLSPIEGSQSLVSHLKMNDIFSNDDLKYIVQSQKKNFVASPENPSSVHTIVSSSQPTAEFDEFDNLLLSKAQQKHQSDEEECLSQSYTVSSSADAQVGSKPNSEEIFAEGSSAVPDSPMQNEKLVKEHQAFIKELETGVENILKKPSPKSIQDKIYLVKYLCCIMKLPPAKVLEILPRL